MNAPNLNDQIQLVTHCYSLGSIDIYDVDVKCSDAQEVS